MKIAAIHIPPPRPWPAGGERWEPPRAGRATFADIRDRIDLERGRAAQARAEPRGGEGRAARWWAPAGAEAADGGLEIQLPREAFTATIVDGAPPAGLGGRPASLAAPAPGTPAAAYVRAAELLGPDPARGVFVSTVV